MGRQWVIALAFVLLAALVLGRSCYRQNPASHVGHISYGLRCQNCDKQVTMSTRELNSMVSRGEATADPEQMRRFKCASCGEMEVILDRGDHRGAPADL